MSVPIDAIVACRKSVANTTKIRSELERLHWTRLLVVRAQVNTRWNTDHAGEAATLGMSALGEKQKLSNFIQKSIHRMSVAGPGCVKTRTSVERMERLSNFQTIFP